MHMYIFTLSPTQSRPTPSFTPLSPITNHPRLTHPITPRKTQPQTQVLTYTTSTPSPVPPPIPRSHRSIAIKTPQTHRRNEPHPELPRSYSPLQLPNSHAEPSPGRLDAYILRVSTACSGNLNGLSWYKVLGTRRRPSRTIRLQSGVVRWRARRCRPPGCSGQHTPRLRPACLVPYAASRSHTTDGCICLRHSSDHAEGGRRLEPAAPRAGCVALSRGVLDLEYRGVSRYGSREAACRASFGLLATRNMQSALVY
jgi:hypothetical protein